jgi:hypothetical protein
MKLRVLLINAVLGVAGLTLALTARAQAVDPCTVYLCMAGMSGAGASGGPGCVPATTYFFSIAIFDPYFDAPATSMARRQYLMGCPGASAPTNAALLNAIIGRWGMVP